MSWFDLLVQALYAGGGHLHCPFSHCVEPKRCLDEPEQDVLEIIVDGEHLGVFHPRCGNIFTAHLQARARPEDN